MSRRAEAARDAAKDRPDVVAAHERVRLIIQVFSREKRAHLLRTNGGGHLRDALIGRALGAGGLGLRGRYDSSDQEALFSIDPAEARALEHARINPEAFCQWVRRHQGQVAQILAECNGRRLGSVESLTP